CPPECPLVNSDRTPSSPSLSLSHPLPSTPGWVPSSPDGADPLTICVEKEPSAWIRPDTRPKMSLARRNYRLSSDSNSSTSTSPERGADDDNDSFMIHQNDSQSSLAPSISQDVTDDEARS